MREYSKQHDVPNMLLGDISPEVKFNSVVFLQLHRLLERKEDGKPGEHARRVGGRKNGDHYFLV